ncbi:hypothetical protein L5515_015492 [Caenorhabditis briggsae]|uniref:Uncharacterized protein n=1 Tax=Caenorhabditis briggsae TaxID=6238 RepID=A0AAE9EG88_CAEBR|nr:hypothetical protein L5515_015492 [Caenorhabditis briggsae]
MISAQQVLPLCDPVNLLVWENEVRKMAAQSAMVQVLHPFNIDALLATPNPLLAAGYSLEALQLQLSPQNRERPKPRNPRRRTPRKDRLEHLAEIAEQQEKLEDPEELERSRKINESRIPERQWVPYYGPSCNWSRLGKKERARRIQKFIEKLPMERRHEADVQWPVIPTTPEVITLDSDSDESDRSSAIILN